MPSKVIHVGQDVCHRLPVLESAGYRVQTCASLTELRDALAAREPLDAILISEGREGSHNEAVLLARLYSQAPIVLFRESQRSFAESIFDLVIPVLDSPETWLTAIAELITRRRNLNANCEPLPPKSKPPVGEYDLRRLDRRPAPEGPARTQRKDPCA